MYNSKQSTKKGIHSVQVNSVLDEQFTKLTSKIDDPYFVLKAKNGEIIGVSEMYKSVASRDNGIASVQKNGSTTEIIEEASEESCDKEFTIIVNGRPRTLTDKKISFAKIVELAFSTTVLDGKTCYTMTYAKGHSGKPNGSMVIGDTVTIKSGMAFNVTATDKS